MILIEDANEEKYHINPKQVIYVKERENLGKMMWKIMMVNGEALMTSNEQGAKSIIASIKSKSSK
tara:strand:+ start:300 stop:494 length:195 start_codon:yes stop_codon:yes gene_type:complete